jgi:hypothetical protein
VHKTGKAYQAKQNKKDPVKVLPSLGTLKFPNFTG